MRPPAAGLETHTDVGVKIHPELGLMFWPVVKNAHSTMDGWLMGAGFHSMFGVDKADAVPFDCFALVREPVDRYISSLWQVWTEGVAAATEWEAFVGGVEAWNRTRRIWTSGGNLHFAPQHDRLGMMPNRTLFRVDDLETMRVWLDARGVDVSRPIPRTNSNTAARRDYARRVLTPEPIRQYYQQDCDHWDGLPPLP